MDSMASQTPQPDLVDGLVQLSFLVQSVLAEAAAAHTLTVPQIRLLGILRDREPGMLELARHLGLDKSSATGLVDRAERRGLVRRGSSDLDGRAVKVVTTPLGRELTETVGTEVITRIAAIAGALDPAGREHLARLIGRILGTRADVSNG
ncbi:MarR family transcriptional regulator [Nakamurella silvestris]|nr:MarR family transcriptional regulator [Nakamurella silvestris]